MSDERIEVEIALRIQGSDGTTVKHIYEFDIPAAVWNSMESWERDDYMRRKLWKRLGCEYKVSEDSKS